MDYIVSFFNHLITNVLGFSGSASSLHSATTAAGSWTTSAGTQIIDESDNLFASTVGTGIVTLGTAVIDAGDAAYDDFKRQASTIQTSQAYIESLPESELDKLIASLSFDEPQAKNEEAKTLTKRL